jgi:hypothetical protein
VYPRLLIFECRRFGTIYQFHLQRLDMKCGDDWKWGPVFIPGTRCTGCGGTNWFRNVGIQKSDAGVHPKDYSQSSLLPAMFKLALETNLLLDGQFMRGKSGRGVKLTIRLHLRPRLRTSGAKSLLSLCFHGVKRENLLSAGGQQLQWG